MPIQESSNVALHDPERAQHLLTMEFGDRTEFDDPKLEYRRLFSELLGTFFLVLVAAGGGILHGKGQISLAAAVVAPGLMVLAIILFMGAVSARRLPVEAGTGLHHHAAAWRDAGVPVPARRVRQR